ncbi:hypothetical protein [Sporosarcina ureilytica]|uniref:Uncharacterized protein n=1 Tax=Sporosarcina ureilytica TaxID=298596 RepID=A0A1D8JFB8_9BACL|nr:hypothetical protein [Sporosarcina ureilytica]AOV07407.1 hypothetical protein BI350_07555 [Sporosarcina ureilytica]
MNNNKEMAMELAKIFIQKENVIPISTMSSVDSNSFVYKIDDNTYTFFEILSHFLDAVNKFEKYK